MWRRFWPRSLMPLSRLAAGLKSTSNHVPRGGRSAGRPWSRCVGQAQAVDAAAVADPIGGAVADPAVEADQPLVAGQPRDRGEGGELGGVGGGERDQGLVVGEADDQERPGR